MPALEGSSSCFVLDVLYNLCNNAVITHTEDVCLFVEAPKLPMVSKETTTVWGIIFNVFQSIIDVFHYVQESSL